MIRIYLSVFLFGLLMPLISTAARHDKFFRKDYTYIEELEAFYKVHWDLNGDSWDSAFLACNDEEANLFYPKHKEEWASVKPLLEKMREKPNVTDIFVGFHNKFNLGEFITVDGHATPYPLLNTEVVDDTAKNQCILMSMETGEFRISQCFREPESPLPFVCKKVEIDNVVTCPTVDKGYKYSRSMKRCYKVNKTPKLWSEAVQTCYMEGGMLVLVETREDLSALYDFTDRETKTYFSGFRKLYRRNEYYTVAGQKFTGEIQTYDNNNDGEDIIINHNCGAISFSNNFYITAKSCYEYLPFICQMELSKN